MRKNVFMFSCSSVLFQSFGYTAEYYAWSGEEGKHFGLSSGLLTLYGDCIGLCAPAVGAVRPHRFAEGQ